MDVMKNQMMQRYHTSTTRVCLKTIDIVFLLYFILKKTKVPSRLNDKQKNKHFKITYKTLKSKLIIFYDKNNITLFIVFFF